jgi:hypothetical protein
MKTKLTVLGVVATTILAITVPSIAWICLLFWILFAAVVMFPTETHNIPKERNWYINEAGEYTKNK